MNALSGPLGARAKASLFAGCDVVLHCNGRMDEMKEIAAEVKPLAGTSARRADAASAQIKPPASFDAVAATARLDALLNSSQMARS